MPKPSKKNEENEEKEVEEEEQQKLKPVKKGKVKKKIVKEVEVVAAEASEAVEEEELLEDVGGLYKSVWVGLPEGVAVDLAVVKKIMQSVGEVTETEKIDEKTFQITFSSLGSIRQALLLHNRSLSQLPTVNLSATDPSLRISVDLPLHPSHRIYIGDLPNHADNREVAKALKHFGPVAYVYRNTFKSYGFAAFKSKEAVLRAVKAEAVVIRGKTIKIQKYQKSDNERRWQESQKTEALAYLNSLVPLNPYVLPEQSIPLGDGGVGTPNRGPSASPFALAPMTPPSLAVEGKKGKQKREQVDGEGKKKKRKKQ